MTLYARMQDTQRLIGDLKQQVTNEANIIEYVNIARRQVAGEAECIRVIGTLPITAGTSVYNFQTIDVSSVSGARIPFNVRTAWIAAGSGQIWLRPRSFEWFSLYYMNNVTPSQSRPTVWTQYAQGVAGSIYFADTPDQDYTVFLDCVCEATDLVLNTDADPIPQPWQDAIPYFAAYLAYLEAQQPQPAERMYSLYETFMQRARRISTPSVLPGTYEQVPNITQPNQLGQVVKKQPMVVT